MQIILHPILKMTRQKGYMSNIPHLRNFDREKIRVIYHGSAPKSHSEEPRICVYYHEDGQQTPLHVKMYNWTCPFGRDDSNQIVAIIPDDMYFQVEALDRLGRDICKMFHERVTGSSQPIEDDSDLPYKSLIHKDDGLDTIHLRLSGNSRVFDSNNVRLDEDQIAQCTAGQFTANFLLSLSCLRVYQGHFFWSATPVQMKVCQFCTLPEGCIVFHSEDRLRDELSKRHDTVVDTRKEEETPVPVEDFDPDVNELMD